MTAPQPPKTYGDSHFTAEQINQMSASQRDAYLRQNMSPSDLEAYLAGQVPQAGQDDNWLDAGKNMAERVTALVGAVQQARSINQQNIRQASSGDVQYVQGLSPSNANYPAIPHDQLKTYVNTNMDPAQVGELSDAYHQMSSIFNNFATTLSSAVSKSQGEWEGEAADSARNYFTSLQKWADGNAQNSTLASEVVYQQSSAASTAKNTMPDPVPFSWTDEVKSWATSAPWDLVSNVQASFDKQKQSQEAHDQAAQVMTNYDSGLYSAASKQPVFAEPPKFDGGTATAPSQAAGDIGGVGSGVVGATGGVGGTGGHSGTYSGGTGGNTGSVSGTLGALPGTTTPLTSGAKTGATSSYGGTRAQGYQQPNSNFNTPGSGSNSNMNSFGAMPPMAPMGGGFGGAGGGDEYTSKVGRGGAGGFGPGGGGSASGSGSAAGSGAQSGAGARAGGAGAAESAAASGRGGTGGTGRGGMSGMGHGGKGQGGEDEEHQRPTWLIEPDPDDIFGTAERTAPPVIGE
ncbi:hypothetical protein HFP15_11545 [Amycolatopsis sp. K13G38]|uniref:PPE family protein n=1 Tax=Amycolatopsis acididurans TaxID=2724524 RepID=A0ABX1J5A0_9PSEU|nr:hypothetical protein [Amycolatopsis acididurans]NKQ53515.1 hypothetical protein [Amycolatopsis acididurans]